MPPPLAASSTTTAAAVLGRWLEVQVAARAKKMDPDQRVLFDETMAADLAAVEAASGTRSSRVMPEGSALDGSQSGRVASRCCVAACPARGARASSPFLRAAVDYETPSDCKLIGSNISAPVVIATCAGVHGLGITGDHHQTSGLCVACAADSACPGDSQVSPRQRLTRMLA